jgi:hypothetical protein
MEWSPVVKEDEELVELIPWRLLQWSEQSVTRSEEWWQSIQPMIDAFWRDVEQAKAGNFVVPESTRAPKRKKEEACQIIFQKLDENGHPIVAVKPVDPVDPVDPIEPVDPVEGSPWKRPFTMPADSCDTLAI